MEDMEEASEKVTEAESGESESLAAVKAYVAEIEARISAQLADRNSIDTASHLTESELRKMDSTLKRTTAFMKKLRSVGSAHCSAILADLEKINLSKFTEEMASSIAEAKLKMSDIVSVVTLCVRLSCLYSDFSTLLLAEFKKILPTRRSDKVTNPSKLRIDVRLFAELCLHGVFGKDGLHVLGSTISYLTLTDKVDHANVPILQSLCKGVAVDLMGLYQYSLKKEAEEKGLSLPVSNVTTPEQKNAFAHLMLEYRKSLIDHVNKELTEMNRLLRSIKHQIRTRGDASAEERNRLNETRMRYEKLVLNAAQLSEVLGTEMEKMVEEQSEDEEEEISAQEISRALQDGIISVWPDEDTRQFYESRMELRQIVPAILFQDSEQRTLEPVESEMDDVDVTGLEDIIEEDEVEDKETAALAAAAGVCEVRKVEDIK
ncbi:hypothetical protein AB6A40_005601 [Gnathostoma spinigerum]|uniref:MIF4G domain-containing protein n=1 Tax=Gnathostoma spinigerum TaxID=75299 RepID=A0ABD6EQQ7_9BILA